MAETKKTLTLPQQIRAIGGVAKLTFQAAPGAVLFKIVGSIIDAVLPIVTTYFAARTTTELASAYAGNQSAGHQVLVLVLLTAASGLVMTVWGSLDQYVQAKMRYIVETRVSNQMFDHFLSLEFWRYDDKETADLYDRSQQFSQFFAYVFDRIATIMSQLIGMVSAVIALLFVNVGIALFLLLALIPGVYLQFRLSRSQIKHWNENVEVRRSLSLIEWNLLQPKLIAELRLYGMIDYLLRLRTSLRDKDEKRRIEIERQSIPLRLLADFVEAFAEVGALIWTGFQIINRTQPIGQFLYVQQIVSRALSSTSTLTSTLSSIDEDVANLFDYEEFMRLPSKQSGGQRLETTPAVISFRHVTFSYRGSSQKVLDDISMTIKQHQHIAIVGENGAGKSTFIKLLTGLYYPSSGTVQLDDQDIREVDIPSWHKQLGVLQQEFIRYGFAPVRENITYGDVEATYDDQRLERAMHDAEATGFIAKLPQGLDNYVNNWMEDDKGNKGVDLSGGQWQRVALARDFYRKAPIIILDEPTSAIDALAEARIFDRLFADKNRTVITVSHRFSTIKKADVIYMFKDGKIVEQGSHTELVALQGQFYEMFKAQIKD